VCEIKFRAPDLAKLMHRWVQGVPFMGLSRAHDYALGHNIVRSSTERRVDPVISAARASGIAANDPAIHAREKELMPVYATIARSFADMHDTPVRMAAKGVLTAIVPWHTARAFFLVRLRRRLLEKQLLQHAATTDPRLTPQRAAMLLHGWRSAAAASHGRSTNVQAWSTSRLDGDVLLSPTTGSDLQLLAAAGSGSSGWLEAPEARKSSLESYSAQSSSSSDVAFLAWAESPAGRAQVAGELRALRCSAAEGMVTQVLGTSEGKEGLLAALQSALMSDSTLAFQLRLLLQEQESGSHVVEGKVDYL
jgi:hypothetical protein